MPAAGGAEDGEVRSGVELMGSQRLHGSYGSRPSYGAEKVDKSQLSHERDSGVVRYWL